MSVESTQALTGTVHTELFTKDELREAYAMGYRAGVIVCTCIVVGTVIYYVATYDDRSAQTQTHNTLDHMRRAELQSTHETLRHTRDALRNSEAELARVRNSLGQAQAAADPTRSPFVPGSVMDTLWSTFDRKRGT